ncbi:MAG: hypothetical protein EKK37_09850 [Sphingobacteriales bacterium]|nr:MAG: hypothetical protein EKK37_09850 [Sphingobacteriales bacterium]
MTESSATPPAGNTLKEKKLRKVIEERLAISLLEYRPILGEKKFDSRIKKAGKLFAADIVKFSANGKKKKTVKKAAVKTD